jgi:hypothetical protein
MLPIGQVLLVRSRSGEAEIEDLKAGYQAFEKITVPLSVGYAIAGCE